MGDLDDLNDIRYASNSTAAHFRCEDCGYKWQVRGFNEEQDETDGIVYSDANSDVEPSTCPMCGCSDILTL